MRDGRAGTGLVLVQDVLGQLCGGPEGGCLRRSRRFSRARRTEFGMGRGSRSSCSTSRMAALEFRGRRKRWRSRFRPATVICNEWPLSGPRARRSFGARRRGVGQADLWTLALRAPSLVSAERLDMGGILDLSAGVVAARMASDQRMAPSRMRTSLGVRPERSGDDGRRRVRKRR